MNPYLWSVCTVPGIRAMRLSDIRFDRNASGVRLDTPQFPIRALKREARGIEGKLIMRYTDDIGTLADVVLF